MIVQRRATRAWGVLVLGALAAGCQSDSGMLRAGIPPKASMVVEGKPSVAYTATADGRLYVYDASDNKVDGRYEIKNGQRFAVDAQAGRATLAGNEVVIENLNGFHNYQLYFEGE